MQPGVDLLPVAMPDAEPPTLAGDGVDDLLDDVFFATIPGTASQDDLIYSAGGASKAIRIAGLGPNSSVVTITDGFW